MKLLQISRLAIMPVTAIICAFVAASASASRAQASAPEWSEIEKICGNPFLDYACTYEGRRATLARFGIPPLEMLHARKLRKGEPGEAVIAISQHSARSFALLFDRKASHKPQVEFKVWTRTDTGKRHRRFKVAISEADWHEVVAKGEGFDALTYEDDICICGSLFVVEAVDQIGQVRARVNQSCAGNPARTYFESLAAIALRNLPQCKVGDPDAYPDALSQLSECASPESQED